MSFTEFIQKEFEIVCIMSYKEKKPITKINKIDYDNLRTLEMICGGNEFFKKINENLYCVLGSYNHRDVKCRYLSQEKDPNDNRTCDYAFRYTKEIIGKLR